jgi:hypothetical protein
MRTFPEVLLAGFLVLTGVIFGLYLMGTVKPLPPKPAAPTPTVSCQLGQLLILPNCYNVQPGNTDFNLNRGNKFSTPGSEYATIYVITGSVRITDIYNSSYLLMVYPGQSTGVAPNHIVSAMQDGTKLQKRVR